MKNSIYFLFTLVFLFVSCSQEEEMVDTTLTLTSEADSALKAKTGKVNVCHYDADTDTWKTLNINGNALEAHLNHGDVSLVDADGDGYVQAVNECVPGGDCDDTNADINPDAEEINDGLDNNCDGNIDETACIVITPLTDANIQEAVELWLSDQPTAEALYGHISNWCTSNITDMSELFSQAYSFNQPIGNWDVSNVTCMRFMFLTALTFNQPIGNWDVSSVTDMAGMFGDAIGFNQPIGNWDVSSVTDMATMFIGAYSLNQPIGNWDVSSVTDMAQMFREQTTFNQPIGNWDVSNVTRMKGMFEYASSFNQDIGNWDVSSVRDMEGMFFDATSFNQPIGNWDVSNMTTMRDLFSGASSFNQDIGNWDVSSVHDMEGMFFDATSFNQPIGNWDVSNVGNLNASFMGNTISFSAENYDNLLIGWATKTLQPSVGFDVLTTYCNGEDAKNHIINTYGWSIADAGKDCTP
ncbi:BspA family leucine-rich repeat surface protein [Algibacter sp.]|nr:BspA family leucine-rich repeat surface protein [Algibacter sp.]